MERRDLEGLTREELIARADGLGVPRPRVLTQAELIDEILARAVHNEVERARARGFLGLARDLLSRVVERGLHLPETARALRGMPAEGPWPSPPPPMPTITLAEIYAAQGYLDRALVVLDDVLGREPHHEEARQLRARVAEQAERARARRPAPAPAAEASGGAKPSPLEGAAPADPVDEAAPRPSGAEPLAVAPQAGEPQRPQDDAHVERQALREPPRAGADASAPLAPEDHRAAAPRDETAALLERYNDAAALPERYDVDEIVGMAVDPRTLYLYWEVRPTTLARAQARRPEGQLVVRLISVLPSWSGPVVEQRDLPIDALFGDMFVRDVPPGSNLRMSTGWVSGGHFDPFAVGPEVVSPRAEPPAPSTAPQASRLEAAAPGAAAALEPRATGLVPGAVVAPEPVTTGLATAAAPEPVAKGLAAAAAPGAIDETPAARVEERAASAASPGEGALAGGEHAAAPQVVRAAGAFSAVDRSGADELAQAPSEAPSPAEAAPLDAGPERFPSGTVPTWLAIARAVAATRGGSSELSRTHGNAAADGGSDPRSLLLRLLERPRVLGGSSELWRSFDEQAGPTPPAR